MKLLDVGAGDGGFLEITEDRLHKASWLNEYGGNYAYGIDVNPQYIEKAQRRIQNGTIFLVADGRNIPFDDGEFDVIHEHGALHHMSDYSKALTEISRVMHEFSILILKESVDNDPFFSLCRRIVGNWNGDPVESFFTSNMLIGEMEKNFVITSEEYYWRFPLSDLCCYWGLNELSISLRFNQWVSKMLKIMRLDQVFCSHLVLTAIKKVK